MTRGRVRTSEELPLGPADLHPAVVFQFRAIVEPAAAALCARNASSTEIDALEAVQTQMEDALHALDLVAASDADLTFHLAIAAHAGNDMVSQVIRSLETPIAWSLRLPFADPDGAWAPAEEHRAVLRAIRARDAVAARTAMNHHLLRAAARIGIAFDSP